MTSELTVSTEQLQLALHAARAGIWTWNAATGLYWRSPELERIYGAVPGSFDGTAEAAEEVIHPDDRDRVGRLVRRARDEASAYASTHRIVRSDGAIRWVESLGDVILDEDGEVVAMSGVTIDVTERVEAEHAVHESEQRFRAMFDSAAVGMGIAGLDRRLLDVNDAYCRLVGRPQSEIVGHDPDEFGHPDDGPVAAERFAELFAGADHVTYERRYLRPDGETVWGRITMSLVRNREGEPTLGIGIVEDVTARRRAELEVAEADARFRALFESAAVGVLVTGPDGLLLEVNDTLAELAGRPREELMGTPTSGIVVAAERDALESFCGRVFTGELVHPASEWTLLRADGSTVPVRAWSSLVRDAHGEAQYTVAAVASMAEQRALEEQVRQTQKMEALGQLAGGVAHDFNNLLQVIAAQTELVLDSLPPGAAQHDALLEISSAAERAAQLTRQLLTFSRRQPIRPRLLDLDEVSRGVRNLITRLIGEDIRLVWKHGPGTKLVRADRGQLEQVLINLVVNARDAAQGDGGTIVVETGLSDFPAGDAAAGLPPGAYVTLTVADDGGGIEPDDLERIFEPFFTTKEETRGTGLGLTTVYGVVRAAGGAVAVDSTPGGGTTFTVRLPRAVSEVDEREPSPARAEAALDPGGGTAARLLLVEDDAAVRRLAAAVLGEAGYAVREAGGPEEALALLADDPAVDLLVTDVVMPVMSGKELAVEIRRRLPGLPVLYVSGYERGILAASADEEDGGTDILQKPFAVGELRAKVADLLGVSRAAR